MSLKFQTKKNDISKKYHSKTEQMSIYTTKIMKNKIHFLRK